MKQFDTETISDAEPWKKIVFELVCVLAIVGWVYELGICIWVVMWTPLIIWRIETVVTFCLALIFIFHTIYAMISVCAGSNSKKCLMTTYMIWIYLLTLCFAFTLIMALISPDDNEKQTSYQYLIGVVYSLANFLVLGITVLLYYCFFYKSAEEYPRFHYQPVVYVLNNPSY